MSSIELVRRLDELDEALVDAAETTSLDQLIAALVQVMSNVCFRGTPDNEAEVVVAELADLLVAANPSMTALQAAAPWLYGASERMSSRQYWLASQKPPWLPVAGTVPREESFISPADVPGVASLKQPLPFGLNTSRGTDTYPGMWSTFCQLNSNGVLWSRPWRIWNMDPSANMRICQVDSAVHWRALVERHGAISNGFLRPFWQSIAEEFDAVHVSPGAVVATDGLAIQGPSAPIVPYYWTVESTLWLRWGFGTMSEYTESSSIIENR
jgi:hypothetical protein